MNFYLNPVLVIKTVPMEFSSPSAEIVSILQRIESGDAGARERLLEITYDQLRRIAGNAMRQERASHTLQPTALINEAVLKIFKNDDMPALPNRAYFFGAMAQAMRQILVDHARKHNAQRRGGDLERVSLDGTIGYVEAESGTDLLSLDEALSRLEQHDKRTYDVVVMRFFGGLEHKQIAVELGVSVSTVDREWRFARAWLKREMGNDDEQP